MSGYYCCEKLHEKVRRKDVSVNFNGTIDIFPSYSSIAEEMDLPYCPWCGTKLLKEATDG